MKQIKIWGTSKRITILISIAFMIFLMTLGLTSAYTWETTKQGDNINLVMICPIAGCNQTNISSIIYPNSSIAISNAEATHNGNTWNYTFTDTTKLGVYKVQGFSTNGTESSEEYFIGDFEVTPSGFVGTLGFYLILLILSLGVIILGYAVEDAWIIMLGSFGLILFGLFIFLYGVNGMKDSAYTYGFAIITIMLGAYLIVRAALENVGDLGNL